MNTGRSGIRHRNGILDMKFAPPAMIEKTKCRVAALLDLRDHKTCADRVDRSGRDENGVARSARSATRQDPRSSRRRRRDAIAAGSDAVSGPRRPWPQARRSGRTRLRSCRSAVRWTARTHRPDEPGWKAAGSVNSSFSRSEGATAAEPERSYQISPIVLSSRPALLQGRGSTTPQGFGKECAIACSIVITLVSF